MKKMFTQKEIYDYLLANPYGFKVHTGDLDDLNNQDYIFFDYLNERLIPADNNAEYITFIQISIASKDYDTIRKVVRYVKKMFVMEFSYSNAEEHEYFLAQGRTGLFIVDG